MSLFDVSRVWDAWPRLSGNQVLRGLFRQVPTHSLAEDVCRVFMTYSHLFVATQAYEPDGECLHVFSSNGEGEGGDCRMPLTPGAGQTVAVVCLRGEDKVGVVREAGQLELFSRKNLHWQKTGSNQLSHLRIFSCTLHPASHSIIYCASLPGQPAGHAYQMMCRCYHLDEKNEARDLQLEEPAVLLTGCPPMTLWAWEAGVALLPHAGPTPPGLLLLWLPRQPSRLQPLILNNKLPVAPCPPNESYPSLCLQLAPLWTAALQEPWVISVTVAMTTRQLMLLLSSGEVATMETLCYRPRVRRVVKLADFCVRYHLLESHKADLQLFVMHTYYGIFCKGEMRLYEGVSGELVWESDEHEGHEARLLAPPSSYHWIGILDNSGVWVLRSRRLLEHTHLMAHGLFPITTNADETTPGDYLDHGRILAAALCSLWGLALPSTRYGLEALHGTVQRDREEEVADQEKELFLPLLSTELEGILRNAALQSPALLVALLTEHPRHRQLTSEAAEAFLVDMGSHGDSITPMTKEVAALLRQFHSLHQAYSNELALWGAGVTGQLLLSPRALVTSLLQRLEGCQDNARVSVRAQLQFLCCSDPEAALAGIRDYLTVPSFESAVEELEGGTWSSDRDWKSLFSTETGSGLGRGVLQSLPLNVPIFEMTCRLLYQKQPRELRQFVLFAQLARDYQAQGISSFARRCRKTYFFQRALNCLPHFVSPETTPTSREALLVHSHLILQSECSSCKGSALGLLLRGRLWDDALAFVEQETVHNSHTYCALFHSLLATMAQEGILHCYIDRAWLLIPNTFGVLDLLRVLGDLPLTSHHPTPLLVSNHTSLTVADVSSRLQELL